MKKKKKEKKTSRKKKYAEIQVYICSVGDISEVRSHNSLYYSKELFDRSGWFRREGYSVGGKKNMIHPGFDILFFAFVDGLNRIFWVEVYEFEFPLVFFGGTCVFFFSFLYSYNILPCSASRFVA